MRLPLTIGLLLVLAVAVAGCSSSEQSSSAWSPAEIKLISSLSLSNLPPLPSDPSNVVADSPAAAALGRSLFFDTRLSGNGKVACASCHLPDRQFQDGTALATGMGRTNRRTMPIAGTAYIAWLFWDGRKDSQWSQALGPLESLAEHGADRTQIAHLVVANYTTEYEAVFGPLPLVPELPGHAGPFGGEAAKAAWSSLSEGQRDDVNRIFANAGKAIAAFERTILPPPTRFDAYADAIIKGSDPTGILTDVERDGLRLFVGKGQCTKCHNGPLFTDQHFHNTGVPAVASLPEDTGRAAAIAKVLADPFNCLGVYSDAGPTDCAELRYMDKDGEELLRAFKPPSLRGVMERAPYMHAGQFATLDDVLSHYNTAPASPAGHSELKPLAMSAVELAALEAFLGTLSADNGAPAMIDRSALKQHLGLERRSITEIATGLSAAAVLGATLYNLGFFAPIEWSLISLLTVQDLLVGAVIAAVPMAAAGWFAMMIGRFIKSAPTRKVRAFAIGLPVLLVAGIGFWTFLSGPFQWTLGHLVCGYLLLGVIAVGANMLVASRYLPIAWLAFSLVYIPAVLGMSDSLTASAHGRPISEIETDRGVMRGSVVRVTSAYLLIARDNVIITMPMSKVREVRRVYVQSAEADFLTGTASVERNTRRLN